MTDSDAAGQLLARVSMCRVLRGRSRARSPSTALEWGRGHPCKAHAGEDTARSMAQCALTRRRGQFHSKTEPDAKLVAGRFGARLSHMVLKEDPKMLFWAIGNSINPEG